MRDVIVMLEVSVFNKQVLFENKYNKLRLEQRSFTRTVMQDVIVLFYTMVT